MGGNGSYQREFHRIADSKRDFVAIDERIENHKILLPKSKPNHSKTPMNSNSATMYLCAKVDKNGNIVIDTIAFYHKHQISKSIDLKFDANGDVIAFKSGDENSSHAHKWHNIKPGVRGRKSHDESNFLPTDVNWSLIQKIVQFNKSQHKWK